MKNKNQKRGFALLNSENRKKIASMGGKASSGNFSKNHDRAVLMGRKGGIATAKLKKM